jgi:hypothetical protein
LEADVMGTSHSFDRWLYRGGRPHHLARVLNAAWAALAGAGFAPERLVRLDVAARRSGRTISLPVVVADYMGGRYLASMLGENASWVLNVRAAGGRAVLRHRNREEVLLDEVGPGERGPILRRYLECSPGARTHIVVDEGAPVEAFRDAAAHIPIFRIRPRSAGPQATHGERR